MTEFFKEPKQLLEQYADKHSKILDTASELGWKYIQDGSHGLFKQLLAFGLEQELEKHFKRELYHEIAWWATQFLYQNHTLYEKCKISMPIGKRVGKRFRADTWYRGMAYRIEELYCENEFKRTAGMLAFHILSNYCDPQGLHQIITQIHIPNPMR